jgi:hypothetical protein
LIRFESFFLLPLLFRTQKPESRETTLDDTHSAKLIIHPARLLFSKNNKNFAFMTRNSNANALVKLHSSALSCLQ